MSLAPGRLQQSREATPTSSGSASSSRMAEANSVSGATSSTSQDKHPDNEDAERFRKRIEMEQAMQNLQQRLKLASVKAENGWTDMSINEIENRLPPSPLRRRREDMRIATGGGGEGPPAGAVGLTYEPPSPSRPWQLIDVLWQPLPPPSRGYPASPSSPLKRSRTDDDGQQATAVRRSSTSLYPHPQSPVGQVRYAGKKRSQSHSHHRVPSTPSTKQDVDAAKALTEMLGSGIASRGSTPVRSPRPKSMYAPLSGHASMPLQGTLGTFEGSESPSRPRASSVAPSGGKGGGGGRQSLDDEDKNAAELMMFLAHSPSPVAKRTSEPTRALGGAARVLFADEGPKPDATSHSNLALAPPITASASPQASSRRDP